MAKEILLKEYCCEELKQAIKENFVNEYINGKMYLTYSWYSNKYCDWESIDKTIKYCPFCGKRL